MISYLDPASELFLADTSRIQQRIDDANRQVTSGKKIATAADAPDQIGQLLQLRADRLHNSQIQSNLVLAKANADAAENAVGSAVKLMDNAITLASQGTSTNLDATTRRGLAQQVQSLQQEMVNLSLTSVQGKYIFSGSQDSSPAYALDLTATNPDTGAVLNGVDQSLTSQNASSKVEDPAGGSFAASKTAAEIFDDGRNADDTFSADNVFNALNTLRLALAANDPTAIAAAIPNLHAASDHLNAMQMFYGNVQTRIQSATDYASSADVRFQTQISQIEDADVTSAALALTQEGTQLQAAFQMRAKMPHNSLFDYLG